MTDINQIRARLAAITTGPWKEHDEYVYYATVSAGPAHQEHTQVWTGSDAHYDNGSRYLDAIFIANAPDDMRTLLGEIDKRDHTIGRLVDLVWQSYADYQSEEVTKKLLELGLSFADAIEEPNE